MDPSDMHVAALLGDRNPSVQLDLFSLRERRKDAGGWVKQAVSLYEEGRWGISYGGAECFEFSSLVRDRILIGARWVFVT